MIWHIFKKDWKLLWPLVLIVAAAQFINIAIWLSLGHFYEPPALVRIAALFPFAVLVGVAALIVTAVHQDAIPGDRQDWLVRPIYRRDLMLEKLLFILVAVHGPMLLADLAQGMAMGFGFWDTFSVALSHCVYQLLALSLPVLALAAMTSTIVEAIGGALALFLLIAIFLAAGDEGGFPLASNLSWMMFAFWSAALLAASVALIPLQYFRRATVRARSIALGAVLLVPLPAFVPWAPAFSAQQWFSADPAAAKAVMIAFDPNFGKFAIEAGGRSRANSVWLPLSVSGLAPNSIVISDRADVRIIGRDGAILFQGRTTGDPQVTGDPGAGPLHIDDFPVRTTAGGEVRTHQLITLPGKIYDLVRNQPVRMELDYSLTLFRLEASDTIAALNGDKRIANVGWCETRLDYNGNSDQVGCIKPGVQTHCATAVLENTVTGQRNPASNRCLPDYTPYTSYTPVNAFDITSFRLSVRDPQGLAKYPVDGLQLANAQVSLKAYQPVVHFTRRLTIPEIRLGNWEADTHQIAASAKPPSD